MFGPLMKCPIDLQREPRFHVGVIKPSLPTLPTLPTFPTYLTYLTYHNYLTYLTYFTYLTYLTYLQICLKHRARIYNCITDSKAIAKTTFRLFLHNQPSQTRKNDDVLEILCYFPFSSCKSVFFFCLNISNINVLAIIIRILLLSINPFIFTKNNTVLQRD